MQWFLTSCSSVVQHGEDSLHVELYAITRRSSSRRHAWCLSHVSPLQVQRKGALHDFPRIHVPRSTRVFVLFINHACMHARACVHLVSAVPKYAHSHLSSRPDSATHVHDVTSGEKASFAARRGTQCSLRDVGSVGAAQNHHNQATATGTESVAWLSSTLHRNIFCRILPSPDICLLRSWQTDAK